jgi:signal transduction histidine kinase
VVNLAELLASRRERIIARWTQKVEGTLQPESMPHLELIDHLPTFLDEVAAALRVCETITKSETAEEHGLQRLRLGFDIHSVVREYGALWDCIVETAAEEGVPLRGLEGEILSNCVITGIADAVTEYQHQREAEQRRQANEHYAFVAHELRNPLGSALSAVSLLRRKGTLPQDDRHVQILERGLRRMQDLIDNSLRVAKLGSGLGLRRERVGLRSLLADAEMGAAANAEEKGITVTVHLEHDIELSVDARLVRSALTNLVRNAVKFTRDGGSVQLRARLDGNRVVVEVEDRCGGLPPGAAEKAFAPFVQLGSDQSGFGLGLAIAKQAADAHEGTIRVQNLPGKGCIFVLELPTGGGGAPANHKTGP